MRLLLNGREATPEETRAHELTQELYRMPVSTALRWCQAGACACSGAANCSGGLARKGYSRKEWEAAILEICRRAIASYSDTPSEKP